MNPDLVFSLANAAVLPGWLILMFAPRRWPLLNAVPSLIIPIGLSVLYTAFVLTHFAEAGGGYGSIAEVRQLFASDAVLTAGWIHYLCFDLFIGAVMAIRMDRAGINRVIQAFILPAIFLFGPLGLLVAIGVEKGVTLPRLAPLPTTQKA